MNALSLATREPVCRRPCRKPLRCEIRHLDVVGVEEHEMTVPRGDPHREDGPMTPDQFADSAIYSPEYLAGGALVAALRIERPGRRDGGAADEEAPLLSDGHRPALAGSFYFMFELLEEGR
jgi:hypothetical protein